MMTTDIVVMVTSLQVAVDDILSLSLPLFLSPSFSFSSSLSLSPPLLLSLCMCVSEATGQEKGTPANADNKTNTQEEPTATGAVSKDVCGVEQTHTSEQMAPEGTEGGGGMNEHGEGVTGGGGGVGGVASGVEESEGYKKVEYAALYYHSASGYYYDAVSVCVCVLVYILRTV